MTLADTLATILVALLVPASFVYGHKRAGSAGGLVFLAAVGSHVVLAASSAAEIFLAPSLDNLLFHRRAIDYLEGWRDIAVSGPSTELWPYAISYLYAPLGASIWLGYAINLWIFFAALIQLTRFCDDIGSGSRSLSVVLIFSLLPSSLLFCNFLLRESFQVWALIFTIRQLEQYRRHGAIGSLLKAAAALVPFGAIHHGFFLFAPIAIIGAVAARMILPPRERQFRLRRDVSILVAIFGILVAAAALYAVAEFQEQGKLARVLAGDIDMEQAMAGAVRRGNRTVFPWALGSSPSEVVLYSPILLVQFLFAPIVPFMVRSPQDLVALVDTLARVVFLFLTYRAYVRGGRDRRRMILYLVANYLAFCMIATIGTTTVGTAMRHHLKMFWIIIGAGMLPFTRTAASPKRIAPHSAAALSRAFR